MIYLLRMILLLFCVGGLVHIFSILTIPFFGGQKVWSQVTEVMETRKLKVFKDYDEVRSLLGQADPAMTYAICHFDLRDGNVTITSGGPTDFWGLSIYNTLGEVIYSLNDGVSQTQDLKLEIRNVQKAQKQLDDVVRNNVPRPAGEVDDPTVPVPSSRPLNSKELAAAKLEAQVGQDDDDDTVRAFVRIDQGFAVFKVFKSTTQYHQLVLEALSAAECT